MQLLPLSCPKLMTLDHTFGCMDQYLYQYERQSLSLWSSSTDSELDHAHPNTHWSSPAGIYCQTELLLAALQKHPALNQQMLNNTVNYGNFIWFLYSLSSYLRRLGETETEETLCKVPHIYTDVCMNISLFLVYIMILWIAKILQHRMIG